MIVDVHAHLVYKELLSDIDNVIKRAREADVKYIISSGTDYESNVKTLELTEKYDIVKASLGLYPTSCLKLNDKEIEDELNFIKENKRRIFGIGEIGLDYKEDEKKHERQKNNFIKILKLSKELDLPVIIHSRKAEEDAINILEKLKMEKVIMHCFSGRFKLVKRILNNKWYFSIPPIIKFSFHFQKLAEETPLNHLLTETDAPFLSPVKGKSNEPCNIIHTINKIAEIKKLDKEEVKKNIFMNFQKLL